MEKIDDLKSQLHGLQKKTLLVGILGLAACVIGAFLNPEQFYQSYLFGYLFWIGLPLGSIVLLSLHHMVAGGWGFVIQRILESGSRTVPLMAILVLPILFGVKELYVWAQPNVVVADQILQHKQAYLNPTFFTVRTAIFFLIWSILFYLLTKWSGDQDKSGDPALTTRLERLGGPAILLYVLTVTFASIDWVMSLDPHWFSTIFGFMFVVGQALLTLAFATLAVSQLVNHKPLAGVIQRKHFHDLGNLILAFVALWAYMAVSQFLIIWSGNLPEEIPWYLHRSHGGWQWLAIFVVLFHFAAPFMLLLMRRNKRNATILARIAIGIIIMRFFDLYWILAPNFHPDVFSIHWMYVAAPVGIGGVWLAVFLSSLKNRPLLPLKDPRLQEAFEND